MIGSHVGKEKQDLLRNVLQTAAEDEAGKEVLHEFKKVTKYDDLPAEEMDTLVRLAASLR